MRSPPSAPRSWPSPAIPISRACRTVSPTWSAPSPTSSPTTASLPGPAKSCSIGTRPEGGRRAMTQILFKNFRLLESGHGELRGGYELLVENDRVRECSDRPIKSGSAEVVDCGGRTLMPGLIDAHLDVIHSGVNSPFIEAMAPTLVCARAASRLRGLLPRRLPTAPDPR